MSATARSVNLALQEPRSVLIRQPAGATPTTVESPTLATHYHTPDIHRSAAQIIRPYARSVRKTGLEGSPCVINARIRLAPWCNGMNHAIVWIHGGSRSSGKNTPANMNIGVMNSVQ